MKILSFALFAAIIIFGSGVGFETQAQKKKPAVQKQTIIIDGAVYRPDTLRLKVGVPAQITIIRKTSYECGEEIVFPAYGIRRKLPVNRAVVVRFTPRKKGSFGFMCGMDMMYGKFIVQ